MKPKLFILKMPFKDPDIEGSKSGLWFCAHCALIEGALKINPHWYEHIEVIHVDFPRPRQPLVDVVGPDKQWLPALIISPENIITDPVDISSYLAETFGGAYPHP